MPLVIPNTRAGTILTALQRAWQSNGVRPVELSTHTARVLLLFCVDAASASIKLIKWMQRALPPSVMLRATFCMMHAVMRIVRDLSELSGCSGASVMMNVQSLSKLMLVDQYYEGLLKAIRQVVLGNCRFVDGQDPPHGAVARSRSIVELCLSLIHI